MNDKELTGKVHSSMYHQLKRKGYATAMDVLMDLEILSKVNYGALEKRTSSIFGKSM